MAMPEVYDFNESVAISVMKQGLKYKRLTFFFDENFLKDCINLLVLAQEHAWTEEDEIHYRKEEWRKNGDKKKSRDNNHRALNKEERIAP